MTTKVVMSGLAITQTVMGAFAPPAPLRMTWGCVLFAASAQDDMEGYVRSDAPMIVNPHSGQDDTVTETGLRAYMSTVVYHRELQNASDGHQAHIKPNQTPRA